MSRVLKLINRPSVRGEHATKLYGPWFCSSKYPAWFAPYFACARLVPVAKRNGGIRPIVDEVVDKLKELLEKLLRCSSKGHYPAQLFGMLRNLVVERSEDRKRNKYSAQCSPLGSITQLLETDG